jgi:hypothetical protein
MISLPRSYEGNLGKWERGPVFGIDHIRLQQRRSTIIQIEIQQEVPLVISCVHMAVWLPAGSSKLEHLRSVCTETASAAATSVALK